MKKESAPNRIESVSKIYEYGKENINNIRAKVFSEFQKAYPEIETEFDLVDRILERFNWIEYQEKLKKEAE